MVNPYQDQKVNAAVRELLSGKEVTNVLVIPDWHIPSHDKRATALLLKYADWRRKHGTAFNGWIQLGDLLDLNILSSHNKGDLLAVEGKRLDGDFKAANRVLDDLQAVVQGPGFVIEGNHEMRLTRYLGAHPELIGLGLTVPDKLKFEDRGVTWVPNWSKGIVLPVGKAVFVHGSTTTQNHASAMMRKFLQNVFYGHTHCIQMHSQITAGDAKVRVAQSLGGLQDELTYWSPANGNKWQLAFADFTFFKDGSFSYTVHQIHDYRVAIGGRIFTDKGVV